MKSYFQEEVQKSNSNTTAYKDDFKEKRHEDGGDNSLALETKRLAVEWQMPDMPETN